MNTKNTGALEILRTFKSDTNKFYTMWLITFIAFLFSVGFNFLTLLYK